MMRIEMMIRMKEVCRGRSSEAGRQEADRVAAQEAAREVVEQGVGVVGEVGEEGAVGAVHGEGAERQEVVDSGNSGH